MKTEEILTALRRLKVKTGSLVCMGCGREHDCGVRGCRRSLTRGGYRMLSCASLAILPDTHRRIRDCVYIWRTEDGRATGGLCGLRIGCRCRMGRRWSNGTTDK